MAFGSMESGGDDAPLAEINMVPLIDVMLVLLIIFMVTAPLLTHAVKLDLPRATSEPTVVKDEPLRVDINVAGDVFWNGHKVSMEQLGENFAGAAERATKPELLIRADKLTHYEKLAQVMSLAARNGLSKIGFLTDPREQ
ncbi:MAG: biopolymer transporter ExbD [Burkholderiales bacterium]|nr:biopolymer transporter ExbD [Burkholderiales bacterium]ODU62544.1 MAG: biopolymer transporter ExbD [Lautropia sp. SCN 66-9]